MKTMPRLSMLVGAGLLGLNLSSCIRMPPPPDPAVTFSFSLPEASPSEMQSLMLAAVIYERDAKDSSKLVTKVVQQNYAYGNQVTLSIPQSKLTALQGNTACLRGFEGNETQLATVDNLKVTPATAKTCAITFLAYQARSHDDVPTEVTLRYLSHDQYSYATETFDYSYTKVGENYRSSESGHRTKGWSLVRHTVLQPTETPREYKISMNSLPDNERAVPIVLHRPSNYFISQSLNGGRP